MADITYKTVITQAIQGFNRIQNKMNSVGAKYHVGGTTSGTLTAVPNIGSTVSNDSLISVEELISSDVFNSASVSGGGLSGSSSLAITPTFTKGSDSVGANASVVISDSKGSGFYIPISFSGSKEGTVSSAAVKINQNGYITSGTKVAAGSFKVTGSVSGTKYIQLPSASLSGSIKATSSSAIITADATDKAGVNIRETLLSKDSNGNYVTSSTEPTSGNYIAIKTTTTASGTGSIGTGWTSGGSVSGTGSSYDTYYSIRSASGFSIADKSDTIADSNFAANGSLYKITVSNLVGKFSTAGYIGTGSNTDSSVVVGNVAKSTLSAKVNSFSATAAGNGSGKLIITPTITTSFSATAGYTKAITNSSGSTYNTAYTIDASTLKPENIRYGISILGVSGTFTNATNPDESGNQQGAELRYYTVTDDKDGVSETHLHSLGMIKGAYAYVDGKLVIGDMNDFSTAANATNTYGANGSGLQIGMGSIALSGTTLSATTTSTGYIESGKTKISVTVPTETKSTTISASGTTTVSSSSGKLMTSVSITTPAATVSAASKASNAKITISKSINSNISTSTSDTYSTGFSISASGSATNGSVSAASVTTAGWIGKGSIGSAVAVGIDQTNNFGINYITKLTIPAGKTFGKFTSSTDYADGVSIAGSTDSIGTLYAGFVTSGYGDLYLRNGGATSYKKIATAGSLITGSTTGGGLSGAGNNTLTVSNESTYFTSTNTGLTIAITGTSKTITRAAITVAEGWQNASSIAAATASVGTTGKTLYLKKGSITTGTTGVITVNNGTIGSATTYTTSDSGVTKNAGSKSGSLSASCTATKYTTTAGWVSAETNTALTTPTSKSGTATINTNATGTSVDDYVLALYQRILGFAYNSSTVVADA